MQTGGAFEWVCYFRSKKLHMAKACTSSKDHGQVGASWWGGGACLEEMITQQPNMVITLMLRFMQLQYIMHILNILRKSTIKDRKFQNWIELIFSNGIRSLVSWHPKLVSPCFFVLQSYFEHLATKLDATYSIFAAPLQPCSSLDTGVLELLAILWCWTKIWSLHAGLIKHRHDSHVEQFTFWSKFWHLHQVAGVRNWKSLIFLTGQSLCLVKKDHQSHTKCAPDVLPRT